MNSYLTEGFLEQSLNTNTQRNEMSTIRDELHQLVDLLSEQDLIQVHDLVKVLLVEPEDLTEEEWEEVRKGEEEIKRGEWVRWEDVKRTDV